ncbi:MAG: rRNA maturation RNase YbeY [Acidobacteria bacterium ACB1]|nr:Endoribonuclease YbeY [Pyrinomonadaceae bacterium]MCE7962991.1 rRNA maturation RNase YbeY [Acidobacteria bacterium ACB1]RIJ94661.1 MAG: rRNA maturation RNase YbeY [Acidobacteriota bacterium]
MILDLQRKVKFDLATVRAFAEALPENIDEAKASVFGVAFVSDRRMKELNSTFRGKDSTTDVLSFPNKPEAFEPDTKNLGDIVISAEQAAKQAAENGLSLETEIKQLILHGVLHLCGYDHETDNGEMNALELELRDKLRI